MMKKQVLAAVLAAALSVLSASPAFAAGQGTTDRNSTRTAVAKAGDDEDEPELPAGSQKSDQTVTLQVISSTGAAMGARQYTTVQPVDRLLAFLPGAGSEQVEAPEQPGNFPIELLVTKGDSVRTYRFYSKNYCADLTNAQAPVWYKTSSAIWDLLRMMTDWEAYPLGTDITYKDETVVSVYSLLYKNRTYHLVPKAEDVKRIVAALEQKKPDEERTAGNVGFLIFTDKGRYPIYLDTSSDPELVDLSVEFTKDYSRIQWLSYIDPALVTSIKATATTGKGYGFANTDATQTVTLNTKDKQTIADIIRYLKNMQINPDTKRVEQEVKYKDDASRITLDIAFESGTVYHLVSNGSSMTISASTVEEDYTTYTAASSQMKALRDYLSMMPGAVVK